MFLRNVQPRIDQCLMENQKPDKRYRGLTLPNMSFAFFVLGPGFGLATIAFIVELVYKRMATRNIKAASSNHRNVKPLSIGNSVKDKALVLKLAADIVIAVAAAPSEKRRKKIKTRTAKIPVVVSDGSLVTELEVPKQEQTQQINIPIDTNVVIKKTKIKAPIAAETLVVTDIEIYEEPPHGEQN